MALKVNNNDQTQFTESIKPVDYEIVTVSKWRYKDYKLNELVYNVDKTGFNIYRCLKNHKLSVYNDSDGVFSIKPQSEKLWESISQSNPSDGGGSGAITDFRLEGTLLTLELANGTTYEVVLGSLDTYVTSGFTSGSDLILINNNGFTVATIDMSLLTNIDTYVESGEVIGSDLILTLNDTSTVTIDVSTLSGNDVHLVSGTTSGDNLLLSLSDNTTVAVNLSGALTTTFTGLTDTPNDYTGNEGSLVGVNDSGTGLEFKTVTTTNGYTKHKYITLNKSSFVLNSGSGIYEYNLSSTDLNAKEIIVYLNMNNITVFNHYVVNLPTILSTSNIAKKIIFITKDFDQTDHDYGLFVKTPWANGGNTNKILGANFDSAVNGLGYFLPVEKFEAVELLFDGIDWLCLNKSFAEYVSAKTVNFFNVDPPGNNDEYLIR